MEARSRRPSWAHLFSLISPFAAIACVPVDGRTTVDRRSGDPPITEARSPGKTTDDEAANGSPEPVRSDMPATGERRPDDPAPEDSPPERPPPAGREPQLALVYRGPGACEGCAESAARLVERAGLSTRFVGPSELLDDDTFDGAALYVQPGGDDTMLVLEAVGGDGWAGVATRLQRFVDGGGRYLGLCLGGFLAARWMDDDGTIPALRLVSGTADYFEHTPRPHEEDQIIQVDWSMPPEQRFVYFQDGPRFSETAGTVYARYDDGSVAALLAPYGRGRVAVSGFHFEAEEDWYTSEGLEDPDGLDASLGARLIEDLMAR